MAREKTPIRGMEKKAQGKILTVELPALLENEGRKTLAVGSATLRVVAMAAESGRPGECVVTLAVQDAHYYPESGLTEEQRRWVQSVNQSLAEKLAQPPADPLDARRPVMDSPQA